MILINSIQLQQLINLLLLVTLSYLNNTLQTTPLNIALLMLYSGFLELSIKKEFYIPYSAFITALGVVLMLGWLKWYIPYVAITFGILQKHYWKIGSKHIFNPSNFALIVAIFLFYPKALPIVGELGKSSYIFYIVLLIGISILIRVNRYIITLSFLIAYSILSYLILKEIDPTWNLEHFISSLYSTSFVVFIFFMLTDPITTPNSFLKQIFFGFFVALVITLLNYFIGIRFWHQFLGLFIVSILFTPFYRELQKEDFKKLLITIIFAIIIVINFSIKKALYFSM